MSTRRERRARDGREGGRLFGEEIVELIRFGLDAVRFWFRRFWLGGVAATCGSV